MDRKYDLNIFERRRLHRRIPSPDDYNIHTGIPALAFCGFETKASFPKSPKYPKSLITIADHLKKRRMDLGLFQEDVAIIIGVSTDCITYWENERSLPQIHFMPKIVEFLGYNPASIESSTLSGKVKNYRMLHGLSHKKMGEKLGVNGSTIGAWEKGKNLPKPKTMRRLFKLIIALLES